MRTRFRTYQDRRGLRSNDVSAPDGQPLARLLNLSLTRPDGSRVPINPR